MFSRGVAQTSAGYLDQANQKQSQLHQLQQMRLDLR